MWHLVSISVVRLLFVVVPVLGDGHKEPVNAQLAVQLQSSLHAILVVERHAD